MHVIIKIKWELLSYIKIYECDKILLIGKKSFEHINTETKHRTRIDESTSHTNVQWITKGQIMYLWYKQRHRQKSIKTESIWYNTQRNQVQQKKLTSTLNLILTWEVTNELTLMQQININTSKHSQTNQIKITRKCNIKTTNSKQTRAPLIVVCLCHDDGATRRQWQPQWEVQRVAEGSVEGVGPLRCRRGNQLTESRGNARQEGACGLWGRNRRRGSLCWGCRELPEAVATCSDLHGERRA